MTRRRRRSPTPSRYARRNRMTSLWPNRAIRRARRIGRRSRDTWRDLWED